MSKKTIYRTVFKIVIVSENELPIDEIQYNLSDAVKDFDDVGASVVGVTVETNCELIGKNAVIELEKHGVNTEIFGMDAQGFELEDQDNESNALNTFIANVDMEQ